MGRYYTKVDSKTSLIIRRGFDGVVGKEKISGKWTKIGSSHQSDSLIAQKGLRYDNVIPYPYW